MTRRTGKKLMLALRLAAIASLAFGATRLFLVGSPIGLMLLAMAIPQVAWAYDDIRALRAA